MVVSNTTPFDLTNKAYQIIKDNLSLISASSSSVETLVLIFCFLIYKSMLLF